MERLQKLIAAAGLCSRRAAEALIAEGRVAVNGHVVTELGTKADASTDEITVDGEPLAVPRRHRYVLLNKPAGYVTTRSDEAGRPTVYDLLYEHDLALHPVGRLDGDTCGLLLLTNDGELTLRLTHPRYSVEKAYHVWTKPWPNGDLVHLLRGGLELADGFAKPKRCRMAAPDCLEIVMTEGRNREVRRLVEAAGRQVLLLRRIRLACQTLGSLREGKARPLGPHEVEMLRAAVGLGADRVVPAPTRAPR